MGTPDFLPLLRVPVPYLAAKFFPIEPLSRFLGRLLSVNIARPYVSLKEPALQPGGKVEIS